MKEKKVLRKSLSGMRNFNLKLMQKEIIKYGFLQICFLSGASIPNNLILLLLISNESPSIILGIPSKIKAKLFC